MNDYEAYFSYIPCKCYAFYDTPFSCLFYKTTDSYYEYIDVDGFVFVEGYKCVHWVSWLTGIMHLNTLNLFCCAESLHMWVIWQDAGLVWGQSEGFSVWASGEIWEKITGHYRVSP